MDMNNLVLRKPNIVLCSDSCPHGLGGYSSSGFAWRFYIPGELLYRTSNNLLEHIAMIITTWVEVLAGRIKREDCVLSMTDSSTFEGWTRKSNFKIDPVDADCDFDPIEAEVRTDICRHFAELNLDNKFCHYTVWFKGEDNDVSDALSRDDDRGPRLGVEAMGRVLPLYWYHHRLLPRLP
jgi:hypothetical protein